MDWNKLLFLRAKEPNGSFTYDGYEGDGSPRKLTRKAVLVPPDKSTEPFWRSDCVHIPTHDSIHALHVSEKQGDSWVAYYMGAPNPNWAQGRCPVCHEDVTLTDARDYLRNPDDTKHVCGG